ncbi:hypothetical protein VE03_02389 [Pseudogymnoascus sp. 23342-1-I1]|nr:hypothetical protein VE03_02389 [Pseudogymnoascus sp. 23342-1-I1]
MMDFPSDEILELPSNISATYLSEGAANVVYTINVPPESSTTGQDGVRVKGEAAAPSPWHGKLLRFRKDLPTTTPTRTAHLAFRASIAPLFPSEDLIDIRLVSLGSSHLIDTLNAGLRAAEQVDGEERGKRRRRPKQRHGVYLADDPHALLITDMSPPTKSTLIQFKPKWLAPSPSAPPGSTRCRTCALHARRALSAPSFCPLDLISSSPADVRRAAALLLGLPLSAATAASTSTTTAVNGTTTATTPNGTKPTTGGAQNGSAAQNGTANGTTPTTTTTPTPTPTQKQLETLTRITTWALTSPLLRHLRTLQQTCDPRGVSHVLAQNTAEALEGLQIAMTLRDVTVFLVVPDSDSDGEGAGREGTGAGTGGGELRARLGDLDVKSLGKIREWEDVERGLGGGWYQGGGEGCWLGRQHQGGEVVKRVETRREGREGREVKGEVKKGRMGGCVGQ